MKAAYYEGNRTMTARSSTNQMPGFDEVRIQVAYCGICGTDLHIFHGAMDKRVSIPQVIGHEMSGVIAEIGANVSGLLPGDPVVVRPLDSRAMMEADRGIEHICRNLKFMGIDSPGALQGSWTVPAFSVHKLPAGTDLKIAALIEPLAVACHDVRMADLRADELAVVIGGGPIGLLIAMVARHRGAEVLITEVNQFRLQLARELGFEAANPEEADLPTLVRSLSGNAGADVVFEASGSKRALLGATDLLAIRGRLLMVAIYPQPVEVNLFQVFWKELRLQGARVYEREDYEAAIDLLLSGTLALERLITSVLPIEEVQKAFTTLESDPAAMKILIDCGGTAIDGGVD